MASSKAGMVKVDGVWFDPFAVEAVAPDGINSRLLLAGGGIVTLGARPDDVVAKMAELVDAVNTRTVALGEG